MLTDQGDNGSGLLISAGVVALANVAMYAGLRYFKARRPDKTDKEYKLAYGKYSMQLKKAEDYLAENAIFYQGILRKEGQSTGLIIEEAYYGLTEHIYKIDAGVLIFKMPDSHQEYFDQQVVPVKKQLQLLVVNGQLRIPHEPHRHVRGIFNPCINPRSQLLLYLRFSYHGLRKVLVTDLRQPELVVPRDVL